MQKLHPRQQQIAISVILCMLLFALSSHGSAPARCQSHHLEMKEETQTEVNLLQLQTQRIGLQILPEFFRDSGHRDDQMDSVTSSGTPESRRASPCSDSLQRRRDNDGIYVMSSVVRSTELSKLQEHKNSMLKGRKGLHKLHEVPSGPNPISNDMPAN